MSPIVEWLLQYGITQEMLELLLFLPLMALLVNSFRYIVGFKMYGIYAPMILAFAYVYTGIRFGLLITGAVVLATAVSYQILRKIRMHYLSRIAINYCIIFIFVIGIIILNDLVPFPFTTDNHNPEALPPLGIVAIASLSEFFVRQSVRKSLLKSLRSMIETVIVGFIGWTLFGPLKIGDILLNNLWLQPAILLLNVLLGVYPGLRLTELLRFSEILKSDD